MVAYTNPDCIPYFECTDPVCLNTGTTCEHDSVWCDQARIIEGRLNDFEQVVARTATTVPMVILQRTEPFTLPLSNTTGINITFTEVVVDTDDMADLDSSPLGFTVNTPGLYEVVCYLFGTAENPAGPSLSVTMILSMGPPYYINGGVSVGAAVMGYSINLTNAQVTPQIHTVLPLQAGQASSISVGASGVTTDRVNFEYALCSAAWIADLP